MTNEWIGIMGGPKAQKHACRVGIVRIPKLGWPVVCETCGKIGYGKDKEAARKLGQLHTRARNK